MIGGGNVRKNPRILLSILLIAALLAGCTPAVQSQPATTQTLTQVPTTTIPTKPQETDPPATQPPTTVPPTMAPPATQPPTTVPPSTEPAKPLASDFTVYDKDGNAVKLSDYFGKPIVLNFWASWCFPCQAEMPDFEKKYKEYGDQIQFLMVNLTAYDDMEEAKDLIARRNFTFPVLFDTQDDAAQVYQVSSIPATYIINEEGRIIYSAIGKLSAKQLQEAIDLLLRSE